jgi:hypothetical protein
MRVIYIQSVVLNKATAFLVLLQLSKHKVAFYRRVNVTYSVIYNVI